jgi:hypothetical protein
MIGRALFETNLFVDHICRKGLFVAKVNDIALWVGAVGVATVTHPADIFDVMYHRVVFDFVASLVATGTFGRKEKHRGINPLII